jgi:glucokinase
MYAIGIDIGGTQVKAVCVTQQGHVIEQAQLDTGDTDNAWQQATKLWLNQCRNKHGAPSSIGVSCPGIARPDGSGISWMIGRMQTVVDFNFQQHFQYENPIPVLNDAMAALVGEVWQGAAMGLRDVIMLTLGTGVGGAIWSNGRLLKGNTGRAGHLGHITVDANGSPDICNTPGSIEQAIGNYALCDRTNGRYSSTKALVEAVHAGDENACNLWHASIKQLAAALASMINVLDPQRIILGGGMIQAGQTLFKPLSQAMDQVEWRPTGQSVPIVPATMGTWAGALGAAYNGMQKGQA